MKLETGMENAAGEVLLNPGFPGLMAVAIQMVARIVYSPRRRSAGRPSLRLRRKEGSFSFSFFHPLSGLPERGWSSEAMTG
jgi:hypothetical protein